MKIRDANNNVLAIDGASGPLTLSAVKKLHQILNLSIYGVCGPVVLSEIKVIMEKPYVALILRSTKQL